MRDVPFSDATTPKNANSKDKRMNDWRTSRSMLRKTGRSHVRNLTITAYDITIIHKVKAVAGAQKSKKLILPR